MTPQQQNKDEAVKACLAKGGKVTKCPTVHVGPSWLDRMATGTTGSNKSLNFRVMK